MTLLLFANRKCNDDTDFTQGCNLARKAPVEWMQTTGSRFPVASHDPPIHHMPLVSSMWWRHIGCLLPRSVLPNLLRRHRWHHASSKDNQGIERAFLGSFEPSQKLARFDQININYIIISPQSSTPQQSLTHTDTLTAHLQSDYAALAKQRQRLSSLWTTSTMHVGAR